MGQFREFIKEDRVRVFDGAMGTMIYSKGVYINRCYDELNLSGAEIVLAIHREYVKAGAEIIETNTYGASRLKLAAQGLDDKLAEINATSTKIARKAASEAHHNVFVAGAISPLGVRIEPYGPTSVDEAKDLFKEQVQALLEGGVDAFVLEPFHDLAEMRQAIRAGRERVRRNARNLHRAARSMAQRERGRRDRVELLGRPADHPRSDRENATPHDEAALGAAQRRIPARRRRAPNLSGLAGVHGQIRQAVDQRGSKVHRRLLRDHAGAHQADCERRARVEPRPRRRRRGQGRRAGRQDRTRAFRRTLALRG